VIAPKVGVSDFYRQNAIFAKGNSYSTLSPERIAEMVVGHWSLRKPGTGEGDRVDRKVVVPIDPLQFPNSFFCPPRVPLVVGLKLQARVVQRQAGEEPHVDVYVLPEDATNYTAQPAAQVGVVCYSAEALLENGGSRSTGELWEIVTLLCSDGAKPELMTPLTMARNTLSKPGGTPPAVPYTAEEWAAAVWESKVNRAIPVRV
jgi:hypothetical protein